MRCDGSPLDEEHEKMEEDTAKELAGDHAYRHQYLSVRSLGVCAVLLKATTGHCSRAGSRR
jgi:hypothetical protein